MALAPAGPRGRLIVTSSGADEASYESGLLRGSPFAHALVSGLRGAADADGDGRVTLAELYSYVYGRTLSSTLAAPAGPQHPAVRWDLVGAGEVVLAVRGAERVPLGRTAGPAGPCYVTDGEDRAVLGEIEPGATLLLRPGSYRVKCRSPTGLQVAALDLTSVGARVDDLVFASEATSYALAKGGPGPRQLQLELDGALLLTGAGAAAPFALVRCRQGGEEVGFGLDVGGGLPQGPVLTLGELDVRFPGFDWRASRLDLELLAGADFRAGRVGGLGGPGLRFSVPLGDRLSLSLEADYLSSFLPGTQPLPNALLLTGGLAFELGGHR